jgi:hypothetical protein
VRDAVGECTMGVRKEVDYVQPAQSDARTHRTPKALTCEIKEALFPVLSGSCRTLGVRARPRAALGLLSQAPARHSEIVGHADRVRLE